nr:phage tail protein [uncultured Mucilaginibacter sp.]
MENKKQEPQAEMAVAALVNLLPVGTVVPFSGNAKAAAELNKIGWFLCNGAILNDTEFPLLANILGNTCGGTLPNFGLPDLRGVFMRGVDVPDPNTEVSRDPGASTRKSHIGDVVVGNKLLSRQDGAVKGHAHTAPEGSWYTDAVSVSKFPYDSAIMVDTFKQLEAGKMISTIDAGGQETRPVNVSVNYIIFAGLPKN